MVITYTNIGVIYCYAPIGFVATIMTIAFLCAYVSTRGFILIQSLISPILGIFIQMDYLVFVQM